MHAPSRTSLTILPVVEQRSDAHRHPLCMEFAWLQIRFSGICSVNDILGLCLTGGHIVRMCTCAAWFCEATAPSLYLPWARDSLIKYSYFPLKYMASTDNPQSAVCPPAQMLFHVWQKSPNVPLHPSCQIKPSSSVTSSKVGECGCILDVPVLSTQLASTLHRGKRGGRTHGSGSPLKSCFYVFCLCFIHGSEKNKWGILPRVLTLALSPSQRGNFLPLKSGPHHNARIFIVDENSPE